MLIRNDAFDVIEVHAQEFVDAMRQAVAECRSPWNAHSNGDFRVANHSNPAQAVWNEHADVTGLIAVGGNCATVLMRTHNGGKHHPEDAQLDLLRKWATIMGYDLVKMKGDP